MTEQLLNAANPSSPRSLILSTQILIGDGSIVVKVLSCHPENGTVKCRCANTAMLGERKNVNLPGVVVDLPTITEKDKDDILGWGVPNGIDFIAGIIRAEGLGRASHPRGARGGGPQHQDHQQG